jgi:starvation-inducible DNA-binding protein
MQNNKTVEALEVVLASSYSLMLKTQNYHWNVVGPNFKPLHELFQLQYEDLFLAVDEVAERIRALGSVADGSFENFSKKNLGKKIDNSLDAKAMVLDLIIDHQSLVKSFKEAIKIAQSDEDEVTVGILVNRTQIHEKAIWMLKVSS